MNAYDPNLAASLSSVGIPHGRLRPTQNGYDRAEDDGWNDGVCDTAQQEIEGAIHFLLVSSSKPAVLIASGWQPENEPFAFENASIYRQAASDAGCVLMDVVTSGSGGSMHYLFLATNDVRDPTECLEYLPAQEFYMSPEDETETLPQAVSER
jgi:hypothetical protein